MTEEKKAHYLSRGDVTGVRQSWRHPEQNPPTLEPTEPKTAPRWTFALPGKDPPVD